MNSAPLLAIALAVVVARAAADTCPHVPDFAIGSSTGTYSGDNTGKPDVYTAGCGSGTNEYVWSFTAPASASFSFELRGDSLGDPYLIMLDYCTATCDLIQCDDDSANGGFPDLDSLIDRDMAQGESVLLLGGAFSSGSTGTMDLVISQGSGTGATPVSGCEVVVPSGGGDPVIVDFFGHRFPAGSQPNTRYVAYQSADGSESLSFVTSDVDGVENDYFIASLEFSSKTCGEATVTAHQEAWGTSVETSSDCMHSRVARGDNGFTAVALGGGQAFVAIMPHHQPGKAFSFLNFKVTGEWEPLLEAGCSGLLCDERHEALTL